MKKKVAIIGAGIAGLATAIRLATKGHEVTIYEKNNYVGGKMDLLIRDEYKFDTGPSLFTQPQNIEELFKLANEPIENYFNYTPIEIGCKYFFENGKVINAFTNKNLFCAELENKLNENKKAITAYLNNSEKIYNTIANVFLNNSLHKIKTWLNKNIVIALKATKFIYLFKSLHNYNSNNFNSKEAIQIFDRYATFNGSNPFKAPSIFSLIPHLEFNEGVYFPDGGMQSIASALKKLAEKKGVHIILNSTVNNIIINNKKAIGIVVNNENIYADIIVSNMDIYFTYKILLNNLKKANSIKKIERSSSALVFYWGIKKEFLELELHNIFFSDNYFEEFNHLFNHQLIFNDLTVYINITSTIQKDHAPMGKQNWFVMVNVPANSIKNDKEIIKIVKENIILKLNRILSKICNKKIDLNLLIETEDILHPSLIEEKTYSYKGALYGSSSNKAVNAFLRHPNFSSSINNLFFCGGTVHPGGGIPLCLKSAKIVSDLIN